MYLRREVESEPFVRRYVVPLAMYVGPRNDIAPNLETGYWEVASDPDVEAEVDTDDECVRLLTAR